MFDFNSDLEDSFEVGTDDAISVVGEENGNNLPGNTGDEAMEEGEGDASDTSEEEQDTSDNYLKMPERKLKDPAPVWKCAVRVNNGAKCNFCGKVYKTKDSNTAGITRHVKEKHAEKPEVKVMMREVVKKKAKLIQKMKEKTAKLRNQPSILSFSVKRGPMDCRKQKKMEEDLVKMTIMMNRPFSDVENPFFRKLLHTAEANFICPSKGKHTETFDAMAVKVKDDLKKEIIKDVTTAGHKTITITSDHGTHGDRFHSKENAVTVARTTNDFVIKKDILVMLNCVESQTGKQIRKEVKEALVERAGYEEDWKVNWVTDGESKQLNASNPNLHPEIGMKICHRNKCVDHTLELASEDTVKQCPGMKKAVQKPRDFVNFMKDSSLAKVAFHKTMLEAGVTPLAVIQGTDNRWFHKYAEVKRFLELKDTVIQFYDNYDTPIHIVRMEDDDWHLLLVYENAMRKVVEVAKVLEGELYPTASSVIPFLDTVIEDLKEMSGKEQTDAGKQYITTLLKNLQSDSRFPDGYKNQTPFNSLTLLDLRHSDLYFEEHHRKKAFNDLYMDPIYDDLKDEVPASPPAAPQYLVEDAGDSLSARRAALLAKKAGAGGSEQSVIPLLSVRGRLKAELDGFLNLRGTLSLKENPMDWSRLNQKSFSLLALFWKAHSSFPATSTSSERAFSMDGLIMQPCRQVLL